MLERRDVANKSEMGRLAMAHQRMQQNIAGTGGVSVGLGEGNARAQSQVGDGPIHQGPQSAGGMGSNDVNSHIQEAERPTHIESFVHSGSEQPLQQSASTVVESGQSSARRNCALGLVASAANAFNAAKDIMETLRSKHSNLATELEVIYK